MLEIKPEAKYLWGHFRYAILLVTVLVLTFSYGNAFIFTFTIICMNKKVFINNGTRDIMTTVSLFNKREEGLLYSAVAIGALISAVTIVTVIKKVGARATFTIYGVLSGVCSLFSPLAVSYGFLPFFILRVIQGSGLSIIFASMGYVSYAWFPLSSTGLLLCFLSLFMQFGPLFTMPTSAMSCISSYGWPGVFYLHAVITFFIFALFYFVYRDSPKDHPCVSKAELAEIEKDKSALTLESTGKKIPYLSILTDKVIIASLMTCFGNFLGFHIFGQFAPIYLHKVAQLSVEKTGFITALPYFLTIGLKFIVGPMSDRMFKLQLRSIQFFTVVPHAIMAILLIVMAKISDPIVAQISYTFFMIASAFDAIGYFKGINFIAGPYTSVIITWFSFISSFVILILPIVVTNFVSNNNFDEWAKIFYAVAAIILITTAIYQVTSTIKPRPWAVM